MAMGVDMWPQGVVVYDGANTINPLAFMRVPQPMMGCDTCGMPPSMHERWCPTYIRQKAQYLGNQIKSVKLEALPKKLRELADECLVEKFANQTA